MPRTYTVRKASRASQPMAVLPRGDTLSDTGGVRAAGSLRILVADDHPVNQQLLLLLLTRMGHHTTLCDNGQSALNWLASAHFDLVLMDIEMPVLDGLAALRALRQTQIGVRRTPVIALTANCASSIRGQAFDAGADDFVAKPLDPAELHRAMIRLLPAVGDGRPGN